MEKVRGRDWCFTINNYTDLEHTAVQAIDCRYLVIGYEEGEECKTPHLQGYLSFKDAKSGSSLQKMIGTRKYHIELRKGTPSQASEYCKKDGKFFEKGELPNQGKRTDLEAVRESIKEGLGMRDIVNVATNYQSLKTAELLLKYVEQKRNWRPDVIFIHGRSESGKTRWAYDNYKMDDIHKQMADQLKWFQSYDAHPVVIIDEVDYSTDYSRLKELCDRYPCVVECKGGSRQFLAKTVVLTSLTSPEVLFASFPENGKEMLRRINRIISLD